ncbi:MAG: hypothetical protein DRN49_02765, partial [Thaumarchaeota archaeon]
MENLANILKEATNTPVKTAWISPEDNIPLITIIQFGGGSEPLALTDRELRTYEFQVDVWARSAKQRDELADKIMNALIKNWRSNYQTYGWWSVHAYRVLDIEEEGVFRKTMVITIK